MLYLQSNLDTKKKYNGYLGQKWRLKVDYFLPPSSASLQVKAFYHKQGYTSVLRLPAQFPQTWWLKATETYFLTVLEAGSWKSRCPQGSAPSEGSRGKASLASSSFWWLQVFFGLWPPNSNLCFSFYMAFSSVSSLLFLLRMLIIGFRTHQR